VNWGVTDLYGPLPKSHWATACEKLGTGSDNTILDRAMSPWGNPCLSPNEEIEAVRDEGQFSDLL
jgi:hypothetical protein